MGVATALCYACGAGHGRMVSHCVINACLIRYVATDFNMAQLPRVLKECGFNEKLKTIFILEGVGKQYADIPPLVHFSSLSL